MIKYPKFMVEKAASTRKEDRELRHALTGVYFDAGRNRLVATDGFTLALVPVETDGTDESGIIPVDGLKTIRGTRKQTLNVQIADGQVTLGVDDGPSYTTGLIDAEFPDYNVIASAPDTWDTSVSVGLDLRLLNKVAEAIGCKNKPVVLTLHLNDGGEVTAAVRVKPRIRVNGDEGIGFLMPMHIEE